jgi:uncharacterized membrane-anchored protein YhcB (DUF1043 family)
MFDNWVYIQPDTFWTFANVAVTVSTGIGVAIGIIAHRFYRKMLMRRAKVNESAFKKLTKELNEYGFSLIKQV